MNYFVCKTIEDCICENCINRTELYVCRAHPVRTDIDPDYWCSDGQWLCQFYAPTRNLKHEILYRGNFIEHLFYNERDAQYREQQLKVREEFFAEAKGKTTEEQLESLFYKAEVMFNDLYEIKKELGFPLP